MDSFRRAFGVSSSSESASTFSASSSSSPAEPALSVCDSRGFLPRGSAPIAACARGSTGRRSPRAAARAGKRRGRRAFVSERFRFQTYLFRDVFFLPRMHAPRAPPPAARKSGARAAAWAHPAPPPVSNARVRPRPHRALRWSGAFYRDRGDHARVAAPSPVASRSPPRPRARPRRPTWRRWTPRGPLPTPTRGFRGHEVVGDLQELASAPEARLFARERLLALVVDRVGASRESCEESQMVHRSHASLELTDLAVQRGVPRDTVPAIHARRTPRAWPPHPRRPSRACPFWMPRMRRNFPV